MKKLILATVAALMLAFPAAAQDGDIDITIMFDATGLTEEGLEELVRILVEEIGSPVLMQPHGQELVIYCEDMDTCQAYEGNLAVVPPRKKSI